MKQKHGTFNPWPIVDARLDAKYKWMSEKEEQLQLLHLRGFHPREIATLLDWPLERVMRVGRWINRGW